MNIIIFKLGYSETFLQDDGLCVSLGDVLRSTPLLRALREQYINSCITWVVSPQARPLLENNLFIDRLMTWQEFESGPFKGEAFDILINLEKDHSIRSVTDGICASRKFGFGLDHAGDSASPTERETRIQDQTGVIQKKLIEMLGYVWKEQEYILGYQPAGGETYDIGLNYKVGPKLPTKELSLRKWEQLEELLNSTGFKVSWQSGFDDLYQYMDWINSCALIITTDSLGLHLALALRKKVLGLFGPTDPKEICFYNRGNHLISSTPCEYMPCYRAQCVHQGVFCMDQIETDEIHAKVQDLWEMVYP